MTDRVRGKITTVTWFAAVAVWLFLGLVAAKTLGGEAALVVVSFGFLVVVLGGVTWLILRIMSALTDRPCPQCGAAVPSGRDDCQRCGSPLAGAGGTRPG